MPFFKITFPFGGLFLLKWHCLVMTEEPICSWTTDDGFGLLLPLVCVVVRYMASAIWVLTLLLLYSCGLCLMTEARMRRSNYELQPNFSLKTWEVILAHDYCAQSTCLYAKPTDLPISHKDSWQAVKTEQSLNYANFWNCIVDCTPLLILHRTV